MYLALKEIKKEKLRFSMIVIVTALIAFLVYFLASLAFGLAQLNRSAVDHWHKEGIVLTTLSNDNIYASSIDLEDVDASVLPHEQGVIVSSMTVYVNDDKDMPMNLVFMGYDTSQEAIRAPLVEGKDIASDNEIIVSKNIKQEHDLSLGDTIRLAKSDRALKVVGFTENSNYNTVPVAYIHNTAAAQSLVPYMSDDPHAKSAESSAQEGVTRVSAILVDQEPDATFLEDAGLQYLSMEAFINEIPGYQAQIFTFGFMIVSLALIASMIIGIFMYILTMQKKSIFGVLKIQGYRNGFIMKSVIYQSLILNCVGLALGLGLTILCVTLLPSKVPVALFWSLNLGVSIFTLFCSFIGTLFSARSILKIDPLKAL